MDTVDSITKSLTTITGKLNDLNKRKDEEIKHLTTEKSEIEMKISDAKKEQERGNVILTNINTLLGL